jgi:RNA polymerase sigma-70 factor (ECF subfamily)
MLDSAMQLLDTVSQAMGARSCFSSRFGGWEKVMPASRQRSEPLGHEAEDLIRQARTGSQAALGELLEAFRRLLLSEAGAQLSSDLLPKEGVSDVVQETFKDAVKDFGAFAGTAAPQFKRWLLAILGHNLANVRRKYYETAKSEIEREVPLGEGENSDACAGHPSAHTLSPSSIASRREEEQLLRQAMERLGEEERQVIHLRHVEQLDFVTVGVRMGISEEAARKRFSRAIERLQQKIEEIKEEWKRGRKDGLEGRVQE